jgi:hypothetical protein
MRHDVSLHQPHQTLHFKLLHPHLQQVLFFHLRLQKGLPVLRLSCACPEPVLANDRFSIRK